ncbi:MULTISPECIES: lauroyl-Kdo(2)-lipid IV(A) myristoyltransferase [Shewanella]|uniref:Lipid A biosynthesis acyltransferase n=1 Tax=Shewanella japonica TaxID=93973 RepID=A0ABM6JKI0_9GAMM|nr:MULTISPECIES: lauroyl-Kdo(2)-lipid IV(A) myristoyltransferase [Shewanella]ARD22074.1 Lipid A biosynthesis (KDO)2-(Lauroyl)-lipid IVA acyltransferase [Shewanella japonica]MBQ4890961.1 lauroyl-Kdo(2)-lipid IV(A) myristoyltransferase [Shewanella sp. MMG014]
MARQAKHFDRRFTLSLLHPRYWGSWLAIAVLFIFGILPARVRDPISRLLAKLVMRIAKKPIQVARINIQTCFPEKSADEVESLIKANVDMFVLALLSQAELLIRSNEHIKRRVTIAGYEHVQAARDAGQPIIFIMPHVWPIDYAGIRLNLALPMVTMAKAHRNGLFNWFSNRLRSSQKGRVYMREAGIRALISELRQDNSFFYLPDEDLGPEQSVFAPLLGTEKATLPVVGRLAQAGKARVIPVKIGYDTEKYQFNLTLMPAVDEQDMVGKDNEAIALNKMVEQVIIAYPEQYMWFLKFLKTRPNGQSELY